MAKGLVHTAVYSGQEHLIRLEQNDVYKNHTHFDFVHLSVSCLILFKKIMIFIRFYHDLQKAPTVIQCNNSSYN